MVALAFPLPLSSGLLPAPAPTRRALRRWRRLILSVCGLLSVLALAATPADGVHLLAVLAGLLPLQVAGLLWFVARLG